MNTLTQYLQDHARILAEQAERQNPPLHNPETDPLHPRIGELLRKPFESQAHVLTAAVKALGAQRSVFLCGECGVGKTMIGMSAVHLHASKAYRALVMCPGHLVEKWERELRLTIPGASVTQLNSWKDVARLIPGRNSKPDHPEWYVIGRDRAKLGAKWEPAVMDRGPLPFVCPQCGAPPTDKAGGKLTLEKLGKSQVFCTCGEPLWGYTNKLRRWRPSSLIQRKLRGFFDYFIPDEAHELAGDDTWQGISLSGIVSACRYTILMTGTLTNGKAESMRSLLFRVAPRDMLDRGFSWGDVAEFNRTYGRIEMTATTTEKPGSKKSMATTKRERCVPGIMPSLFGHMLMGNTIFLSLKQVADALPDYDEEIVEVPMGAAMREHYKKLESELRQACRALLVRGDRRLLGTMLHTLLTWPEHPFGWGEVGYRSTDLGLNGVKSSRFIPVTQPVNLDHERLYPKEEALVQLCKEEREAGRQVWVYVQHTHEHDVAERVRSVLQAHGLKAGILRHTVEAAKRERWIAQHGPDLDVCISHPQLVQTGVDFFDHAGTYNFPTIVFYEIGYKATDMRQASRRAWRIGQKQPCRVIYMYYAASMSDKALALMGRKLVAAEAIEGKFSSEGLAALAEDDALTLAKAIAENLDEIESASQHWDQKPDWAGLARDLQRFQKALTRNANGGE